MNELDKVEKLRQRADVSYEEARDALRACDGDLLDAMVYLERLGQAKAPEQTSFSTNAEEKKSYENVPEAVVRSQDDKSDPSFGEQLGHLLKTAFRKSLDNYLVVSHRGEEKFRLPIRLVVLIFLFFNLGAVIALVISLFFDVKYQFVGKDDLSKINRMMDEAGTKATDWMHESYRNEHSSRSEAERQEERQARREEHYAEKAKRKAEKWEQKADKWGEKVDRKADFDKKERTEPEPTEPLETFSKKEVDELAKKYDNQENNKEENDKK